MAQFTLVAFYGPKPQPFSELILECQGRLRSLLGHAFAPYEMQQVHATIIGLESAGTDPGANANFLKLRNESRKMDIHGLLRFLEAAPSLPMSIRIGGFADRPYTFTSRGEPPFVRSFSICGGKPVVIGWPTAPGNSGEEWPQTLDSLRRSAQQFGILHSYHVTETNIDNDFFFRLGVIEAPFDRPRIDAVEADMRRYLSSRPPLDLTVTVDDLRVARYSDDRLPPQSTTAFKLGEVIANPGLIAAR